MNPATATSSTPLRYDHEMPLWATIAVVGVITTTGAGLLKVQLAIQRELGGINATITADAKRIDDLEAAEINHQAEHVAYRNGYKEDPAPWRLWR